MSYTAFNYPTKAALKADVKRLAVLDELEAQAPESAERRALVRRLTLKSTSIVGDEPRVGPGRVVIEGPQYPQPHRWYAQCNTADGVVISAK